MARKLHNPIARGHVRSDGEEAISTQMINEPKRVEDIQIADFKEHPVWEFVNDDSLGETAVQRVESIPVPTLCGKVVGTMVQLANRRTVWATLGNINENDPRSTEQFLALSIERDGKWFHLSRYHDFDYDTRGPEALANFLGLVVDDVFPISYDLARFVEGNPAALVGQVAKKPKQRLSKEELIALAIPKRGKQ
jgi:hypothetical protein